MILLENGENASQKAPARLRNKQVKRKEKGGKMQDSGSLSNNPVIQGGGCNYLIISIFKKIPLQNHGYKNTIFYSCPCVRAGKVFNKISIKIVDKQDFGGDAD